VSRLLALAVDAILLTVVTAAIAAGVPAVWSAVLGSAPAWLETTAGAVALILPFSYFWISWWILGSTAGDLLFGLVVRRSDGSQVGAVRSGLRAFLGLLLAPVWLVGMVLTMWYPRRRALHDVLMGTVVRQVGTEAQRPLS
jgi:hypothetical protein